MFGADGSVATVGAWLIGVGAAAGTIVLGCCRPFDAIVAGGGCALVVPVTLWFGVSVGWADDGTKIVRESAAGAAKITRSAVPAGTMATVSVLPVTNCPTLKLTVPDEGSSTPPTEVVQSYLGALSSEPPFAGAKLAGGKSGQACSLLLGTVVELGATVSRSVISALGVAWTGYCNAAIATRSLALPWTSRPFSGTPGSADAETGNAIGLAAAVHQPCSDGASVVVPPPVAKAGVTTIATPTTAIVPAITTRSGRRLSFVIGITSVPHSRQLQITGT